MCRRVVFSLSSRKSSLEELEAVVSASESSPLEQWNLELCLVEGEDFKTGKVLRKLGIPLMLGQAAKMTLGDDLGLEVEMQVDRAGDIAELRVNLSEQGGDLKEPSFNSGFYLPVGRPSVIQSSVEDGETRRWVATARTKVLGREIDLLLNARGR